MGVPDKASSADLVGLGIACAAGGDGEQALVRFPVFPQRLRVHVEADAAAVDLAGAKMDELERARGQARFFRRRAECLQRLHGTGKNHCRVVHSWLHDSVSFGRSGHAEDAISRRLQP